MSISHASNSNFRKTIHQAGLANWYEAQGVKYQYSLESLRSRYEKRPADRRSAAVAQSFLAAQALKNTSRRYYAWLIAVRRSGYTGYCMTNEQVAEVVSIATDSKCSARSISRSNAELVQLGLVIRRQLPTGTKVQTGNRWITRKVNQIILTPTARLLADCLTSPHVSLPLPKRRPTPRGEYRKGKIRRSPSCNSPVVIDQDFETSRLSPVATPPPLKAPQLLDTTLPATFEKDVSTCPPSGAIAPLATVKHGTLQTGRQGDLAPLGRRSRSARPLAWTALRIMVLHELEKNLDCCSSPDESRAIFKLARIQTAESFPPLIPTPVDWTRIVFTWRDRDWHQRRAYIRQVLIPQLAAAVVGLVPVDKTAANDPRLSTAQRQRAIERIKIREHCASWQRSIAGEILSGNYPKEAKIYASENSFLLDTFARLVNTGQLSSAEIERDTAAKFRELADMIGAD